MIIQLYTFMEISTFMEVSDQGIACAFLSIVSNKVIEFSYKSNFAVIRQMVEVIR